MKTIKSLFMGAAIIVAGTFLMLGIAGLQPTKAHAQPASGYFTPGILSLALNATNATTNVDLQIPTGGKDLFISYVGQNSAAITNTVTLVFTRSAVSTSGATNEESVPFLSWAVYLTNQTQGVWCTNIPVAFMGGTPYAHLYSVQTSVGGLVTSKLYYNSR